MSALSNSDLAEHPVLKALENLKFETKLNLDYSSTVEQAFLMGLWYKSFPPYMVEHLDRAYDYELEHIDPDNKSNWYLEKIYPHFLKFQFISDTGDSWYQCYRDLRSRGWQRLKVWREGGRLQYLFQINGEILQAKPNWYPPGFDRITLLLDISISTCKRVQVGTKIVEEPIWETKCDDLIDDPTELEPGKGSQNTEEFKSLMTPPQSEEEFLGKPSTIEPSLAVSPDRKFEDDIPF